MKKRFYLAHDFKNWRSKQSSFLCSVGCDGGACAGGGVAVSVVWGTMVEPVQEEAIGAEWVLPGPLFL